MTNIENLVRDSDPVATGLLAGPVSAEAAATFRRVIDGRPRPQRLRLAISLATFAAAAIAAVVALAVLVSPTGPARPVTPAGGGSSALSTTRPGAVAGNKSPAAAVLIQLAGVALVRPADAVPGPGQYLYTESEEVDGDCTATPGEPYFCDLQPEDRQIWIGSDGSGRIYETFGTPGFLTPADRLAWVAAGSPPLSTGPSDTTFSPGPGGLSDGPTDLSALPTDPSELAAAISSRRIEGGPPGPGEDFVQIGDLLRETDASPALRAALFQVASQIPGVVDLGAVTDRAGRPGVGLAYLSGDGTEDEYIFDPSTSAFLAEQVVATSADADGELVPIGTVLSWTVYLASGVVDSISSTPVGVPAPPAAPPAQPAIKCTAPAGGRVLPPGSIAEQVCRGALVQAPRAT